MSAGSSSATKVIRIPLEQLNRRACHSEETPARRLANKTGGQWQANRVRDSPCKCPSHLKQSSKAGKHAKSCQWFPLATGKISDLTRSSKANQVNMHNTKHQLRIIRFLYANLTTSPRHSSLYLISQSKILPQKVVIRCNCHSNLLLQCLAFGRRHRFGLQCEKPVVGRRMEYVFGGVVGILK